MEICKSKEKFFKKRIEKLRYRLKEKGADGIIILKEENIYYLTGLFAKESGSMLVVTEKDAFLIVHFIYLEKAKKSVVLKNLNLLQFQNKKLEKLEEILEGIDGINIGIETNHVSYDTYMKYVDTASAKGKKLINLPGFIEEQRIIKDEFELSAIIRSCRITDEVIKNILKMNPEEIKNYSEIEFALFIEEMMIKMGATSKSFNLIVACNAASSLPHYEPSHNKINDGMLLFDIGCIYNHYCSDITRTVFTGNKLIITEINSSGKNNDKIEKIYDIVLRAQIMALEKCREGITCRELDAIARNFIEKNGYGKYFGHGLGHGTGLEVHEGPRVSYTDETVLKENMVVTVEPGIYIEGTGGVRIEDMVIVKKKGCVNLYNSPKKVTFIGKAGNL